MANITPFTLLSHVPPWVVSHNEINAFKVKQQLLKIH